jgi:hypothetical protein
MYNRNFLAPIKSSIKRYNKTNITDDENSINYNDLIKQLDEKIDKKVKEITNEFVNKSELGGYLKNTDMEKVSKELVNYTYERTKVIPNFCTTIEELQNKLKDKSGPKEMIELKQELLFFINKELKDCKIGGFIDEIQLIENPEEYKEYIKGNFKIKKVGKTCYKIYGRIYVDRSLDGKMLTFNFPSKHRTEFKSLCFARLYDENNLSLFTPLIIEINRSAFCLKTPSSSKTVNNSFVSFEHIIELLEINRESNNELDQSISNT